MKVLQFGDLHHDGATHENTSRAMNEILLLAEQVKPDVIVNTGDLVMRRGHVSPELGRELRQFHAILARHAHVIVVAGNHDLPALNGDTGAVEGLLGVSSGEENMTLVEYPEVVVAAGQEFVCVPYPPRSVDKAGKPLSSEVASALLLDVVRDLCARAPGAPLVFHGTIRGSMPGSEAGMGFDVGLQLDESQIPETVPCVMAGHIHKPQTIGRAVYPGSTTALSFGEEQHAHGATVWVSGPAGWVPTFAELEPAVRYLTIDLRADEDQMAKLDRVLEQNQSRNERTIVRVLYRARRGVSAGATGQAIRGHCRSAGVKECRLVPELVADERTTAVRKFDDVRGSLAAWAKEQGLKPEVQRGMAALEVGASAELAGRFVEQMGRGSYRLTGAKWHDFRSLGSGLWEDAQLGRLVCIQGENASGKSNLAEVEAFALWGRSPRGRVSLADVPRRGTSGCSVEVAIEHGGEKWSVIRTVKVTATGTGTGAVSLFRWADGGWADRGGQSADTQAAIEAMVGSWEMYLATRFASQGDVDRLLSMKPAELKDVLQEAAALDQYADREAWAAKLEPGVKELLAKAQGRLDAARERCGLAREKLETAREMLVTAQRQQDESHEAAKRAEGELGNARTRAANAEARLEQTKAEAKRLDDLRRQLRAAQSEDQAAALEAGKLLVELTEFRRDLQLMTMSEAPEQQDVAAAEAARDAVQADLQAFHEAKSAARIALHAKWDERLKASDEKLSMARQDQLDAERALARELGAYEAAVRALERRRDELTKTAAMAKAVLFGEGCEPCPLARSALDASRALGELSEPDAGPRDRALTAKKDAAVVVEMFHVEHERLKEQKSLELHALDELGLVERDELQTRVRVLDERVKWVREAESKRLSHAGRLERARAEIAKTQAVLDAANERCERARARLRDFGGIDEGEVDLRGPTNTLAYERGLVAELESELKRMAQRERDAIEDAATVRAAVTRLEAEAKPPVDEHRAVEVVSLELESVQEYRRAMGRDGIPFLKVVESIGALESWANEFLGLGDMRLTIEGSRETQKGEKRDEVVARYTNRFGGHELSAASGFERVALGYALRAAMARLHAENRGIRVGHWVADEGWGSFDEANLSLGQQMLERLGAAFDRVFFISHVAAIREVAETVMTVEVDTENGSRVSITS